MKNFKPITFVHKDVLDRQVSKYRVYTDHKNYIIVEADNAQSAFEKCGVINPQRLLKDDLFLDNVVSLESHLLVPMAATTVDKKEEMAAVPLEQAVVAAAAVAASSNDVPAVDAPEADVPADMPVPDGALSSDDVNKLLNQ